ncbi:MAG: hypothetical protein A4S09_03985 [Proteobacteria bacterium SG_bin7]|nr:MAG: hypothetical protein A4S09_03985 [Proteobacteria bacterium SG_bin7]
MKKLSISLATLSLLLCVETHAVTCRLKTDGYGTFVGQAKTENAAFELAAEKCFDSMKYLKEKKSKRSPDEDQQISFIDYCVNLSCS